jgi:periplasmic copper chaperone A
MSRHLPAIAAVAALAATRSRLTSDSSGNGARQRARTDPKRCNQRKGNPVKTPSLALALLLGSLASASAHVSLQPSQAIVGASFKTALVVPHGCAGSATTRLTVTIPEGVIAVKPTPKPGWTIEMVKAPYQQSYKPMHGDPVAEGVRQISWSGRLDDGLYDEFSFVGTVTDTLSGRETLSFPTIQACEQGTSNWTEIAADGESPHTLKSPAPVLRLVSDRAPGAAVQAGDLVVTQAWSRATPSGAKVASGYLTIENKGTAPDRLLGGSSDAAAKVEVHEMATRDGVMTMRSLDGGLSIAPGATVKLAPNGYHLMLTDITKPLKLGDTVTVTLDFEKAGKKAVTLRVLGIGAKEPDSSVPSDGTMDHEKMDHGKMKM